MNSAHALCDTSNLLEMVEQISSSSNQTPVTSTTLIPQHSGFSTKNPALKLLPHHGQFRSALLNEIPVTVHHSKFVCAGHTAVVVEETGGDPLMYIFGGGNDEVSYSNLYIFNMRTKEWFLVSRGNKQQQISLEYPFERECHTAVLRQSKDKPELVIFGGLTDMETRLFVETNFFCRFLIFCK